MKQLSFSLFIVFLLCTFIALAIAAPPSKPTLSKPSPLMAAQKAAANKIIQQLLLTEQFTGSNAMVDMYHDRANTMAAICLPIWPKLPDGKLKVYLELAVQAHLDAATVMTEYKKNPYYDMMEKQKAPGIIKKYGLPVDLRSQLPYGKVEQYKIDYIKKNIWAVATTIRQDAQTMIK